MWMNESEVEDAARLYKTHPVLGPATRTLVNLVMWTNANSDGWPYWPKPANAAAKLQELIGTRRAYMDDRDRRDVTAESYRAALRPLKAFRTRMEKTPLAVGRAMPGGHLFEICEPLKGSGEVWAAEQDLAAAERVHAEASTRERAARELVSQATAALDRARFQESWAALAKQALAAPGTRPAVYQMAPGELERLVELATPGTRLWVHDSELGKAVTALGVQYAMGGAAIAYQGESQHTGHAYLKSGVMPLDKARSCWWVTDLAVKAIVAGGFADRGRVESIRDEHFPDGRVVHGSAFMPEA